jgi:hypothetical protein
MSGMVMNIPAALGLGGFVAYGACKLYNVCSNEIQKQDFVEPPKRVVRRKGMVSVHYGESPVVTSFARRLCSGGTFVLPHRVVPPRCACENHAWNYHTYEKTELGNGRLMYHYTIGSFDTDPLSGGFTTRFRTQIIGKPSKLLYNGQDITGMSKSPPIEEMVHKHEPGCMWAAVDRELEENNKCTCRNSLVEFDADCKYHNVSKRAWNYMMHVIHLGVKHIGKKVA